jgi:colanic acid/amylovoran biosynthesis glycosyltransferase
MQRADVLLHAATSEGFCYVAVEAQAMQLPVVTSDADGLPENVADGVTGRVVARRDPQALCDALAELAADRELRRKLGRAGRERVLREFTVDREITEFEDFYRRVLARKRATP